MSISQKGHKVHIKTDKKMNIGILTFHWATNYGAVLQAYALSTFLKEIGHTAVIINYKPRRYDNSLWGFFRNRHFMHPILFTRNIVKEKRIDSFRCNYLSLSDRCYKRKDVEKVIANLDIIICGSDQIWNSSFLRSGENKLTTTYFLDFDNKSLKRIAYAASFGSTTYPKDLSDIIKPILQTFNDISVREASGIDILSQMGINAKLVPDPTLLITKDIYDKLLSQGKLRSLDNSAFVYMLRNESCHRALSLLSSKHNIIYSDTESIEQWIYNIKNAKFVVTNSFHCMIFCLLYHVPFSIVLRYEGAKGMNDRFYTLLSKCDLLNLITTENSDFTQAYNFNINWETVDTVLSEYKIIGQNYLIRNLI